MIINQSTVHLTQFIISPSDIADWHTQRHAIFGEQSVLIRLLIGRNRLLIHILVFQDHPHLAIDIGEQEILLRLFRGSDRFPVILHSLERVVEVGANTATVIVGEHQLVGVAIRLIESGDPPDQGVARGPDIELVVHPEAKQVVIDPSLLVEAIETIRQRLQQGQGAGRLVLRQACHLHHRRRIRRRLGLAAAQQAKGQPKRNNQAEQLSHGFVGLIIKDKDKENPKTANPIAPPFVL